MALSVIWVVIVTASFVFTFIQNTSVAVSSAALNGAAEAVNVAILMTGPVCLWSGVCKLLDAAGASGKIARLLRPLLIKLFPEAGKSDTVLTAAAGCVTANFLGLGNAATPLGIEAVTGMKALTGSDEASPGMCRFIVLCTASIQLIPSTVAALRSSLGSVAPFDILPAVWLTSGFSVAVGLLAAFALARAFRPA